MGAPTPLESSWQVWNCQACGELARAVPAMDVACKCARPVLPLRPTRLTETQIHGPKRRPLKALSEEEGRQRALARRGKKVRVTLDATVASSMLATGMDGRQHLTLTVVTPDGRRITIDPEQAGVTIEALDDEGET